MVCIPAELGVEPFPAIVHQRHPAADGAGQQQLDWEAAAGLSWQRLAP
jgi:hypothetical protein